MPLDVKQVIVSPSPALVNQTGQSTDAVKWFTRCKILLLVKQDGRTITCNRQTEATTVIPV